MFVIVTYAYKPYDLKKYHIANDPSKDVKNVWKNTYAVKGQSWLKSFVSLNQIALIALSCLMIDKSLHD